MSPEFQKIMFDPSAVQMITDNGRVQGTGLGMAISRNIVNLMNGQLLKWTAISHKETKITAIISSELSRKRKRTGQRSDELPVLVGMIRDRHAVERQLQH